MRLFHLDRIRDETGVSGTGIVAEGVEFSDGRCAMRWMTPTRSTTVFDSIDELLTVHGHGRCTVVRWLRGGKAGRKTRRR